MSEIPLGANLTSAFRCEFRVWAPLIDKVDLHIVAPDDRRVAMTKSNGYHEAIVDADAGTRYFFTVNDRSRPDPASRLQPEGVHGPSEVVSHEFEWHDAGWAGVSLENYVLYELHVGTYTAPPQCLS